MRSKQNHVTYFQLIGIKIDTLRFDDDNRAFHPRRLGVFPTIAR